MGLLDFNIAEMVSRMVRGGGVRGRVRPTLDDGILPAIRVGDWTQAPYRTDERRFFACQPAASTVAGQFSVVLIENASPLPVILEALEYTSNAAAALTIEEILRNSVPGFANVATFFSGEGAVLGAPLPNRLPLVALTGGTAAGPLGGGPVLRRTIIPVGGTASPVRVDNYDLLIPPNASFGMSALTVNSSFSVSARIRAPQQALPT